MTVSGLVFVILLILAGVLFILLILVLSRYRRDRLREDLRTAVVLLVIALVIMGLNLGIVRYDSIRYYAVLHADGGAKVTIPVPNEQAVFDELRFSRGIGVVRIVNTEKGTGLEVSFDGTSVWLESEIFTRRSGYDHSVDLMDESDFHIHVETTGDDVSVEMGEIRIIHESPFTFYSDQVMYNKDPLQPGWNSIGYEVES